MGYMNEEFEFARSGGRNSEEHYTLPKNVYLLLCVEVSLEGSPCMRGPGYEGSLGMRGPQV